MKFYNLLRIAPVLLLGSMSPAADEGEVSKVDVTIADMNTVLMETTFRIDGPARGNAGRTTLGTVFIIGRPFKDDPVRQAYVLVTAAHVLNEIDGQVASLLVRRRNEDGTYNPYKWPIAIRDDYGAPLFVQHKEADVAAMYVRLPNDLIQALVSTNSFADDKAIEQYEIHPGDELMCVGFPYGLTVNNWGFPILRTGVISSYPLVPAKSIKYIGFDFRVFGGNSGGPVYFRFSNRYYKGSTHLAEIVQSIIGLVTEQVSDPASGTSISLARIVPAQFILETVNMLPEYTGK
jgi:S1-C subfamily serine protease